MIPTDLTVIALALSLASLAAALWAALRGKRRPALAWIPVANPSQERRGDRERRARRRHGRTQLALVLAIAVGFAGFACYRLLLTNKAVPLAAIPNPAGGAVAPGEPKAVVLDLDETVIDNGPFQAYLIKRNLPYSDQRWSDWLSEHCEEMKLVPGASAFLQGVRELGLEVIYISNRPDRLKDKTEDALKRLGAAVHKELLLQKDRENKVDRRRDVEERYDVVAYFGDNLSDFPGEFELDSRADLKDDASRASALKRRLNRVAESDEHWGKDWFVLPNPVYGDFRRLPDPADPIKSLTVMNGPNEPAAPGGLDARSDLTAMIWLQTSAERDAMCRQIYRMALTEVRSRIGVAKRLPAP